MYLCECKPQVRVPEEARRGFPPLELEPQQVMSWQCGCWGLSLGPLQELFTAELSRRATNLKLPSLHGKLKTKRILNYCWRSLCSLRLMLYAGGSGKAFSGSYKDKLQSQNESLGYIKIEN